MPYLSKKRVWTRQPQTAIEIDWAAPITKGLVVACLGSNPTLNYANNQPISRINNIGDAITADGKAVAGVWDADTGLSVGNDPAYNPAELTVFIVATPNYVTSGTRGFMLFAMDHATLGRAYVLDIANWSPGLGVRWFINGGGVVGTNELDEGVTPTVGRRYVVGATSKGSNLKLYLDGNLAGSTSSAPTKNSSTADLQIGRRDYVGYNESFGGTIPIALAFNRELSSAEIKALSENPWQVFKKQDKRIWVPSAGGGGVHTTTSILTSDVATISGTSLHKILHTGVGNLTSSAATLTGTSVHTTPSPTHNTAGVLSASNSSITGIAARYREHQTTGILTTTNATINGTTNNFSVITSTGVLSSNVATLAGVMSITPAPGIHISTGVLQSNSSTITGILTHTATGHTLTGTLVSSVATLNGNVAHNTIHSSSGTLVSSVATINGTASSSGIITLTPADIEAIANAVWQHPWALTLPKWLALK